MGIAIFFFHYAQYTNNMLFADYAMDLIDQILNQLHVNSPANYKKGIAGIGVGLDYMIINIHHYIQILYIFHLLWGLLNSGWYRHG